MKNFLFTALANTNIFIAKTIKSVAEAIIGVNNRIGWVVLSFVEKAYTAR